ncbi:MAG TPA: TAXI family TRAP transporter solute-binding subunit, partial [Thermodesulfobacteriota bacterium]|nr:TAXI family TRAP transporter solute-binding subunit [Thermodesulfobacteriota bacterium]
MKRFFLSALILFLVCSGAQAWAQKTVRLSIATGGTGGSYFPIGGGMAGIISKYIPYAEATAEVTNASIDNCLLVGKGKAEMGFSMGDTAWEAYQGTGKFKEKIPLRAVAVIYPNTMHLVTTEGKGIESVPDLKGKRVSTCSPGSGTEIMALRLLEAYGLNVDKDMKRDRLGASESAGAVKDKKIDAYFWVSGLPTPSVTELGATPGIKIKLVAHADAVPKMRAKYGPLYSAGMIPAKTYPGQTADVPIALVVNMLVCHENAKESLIYDILKSFFDHKKDLEGVHSATVDFKIEAQRMEASPIPYHPGAIRYFT